MIKLENVTYQYNSQQFKFNCEVQKGEWVTVLGPSGAGKSTLLSLIAGFINPKSGHIFLNGIDETNTRPAQRPISMLFQDNNLFMHLTVEQNLALGLSSTMKLKQVQKQKLIEVAQSIDLFSELKKYPDQLSGGQKQRVALGRCLLQHKPIFLLDEPFSSLDPKLKNEMFKLLNEIYHKYNLTIIMVTHQLEDIQSPTNRCFVIENGTIIYDGSFSALTKIENQSIAKSLGLINEQLNNKK
ncbi:thiamine ABC transporter ATP-binding protein ThiQ [Orbaceae bacterium ac157xtp]